LAQGTVINKLINIYVFFLLFQNPSRAIKMVPDTTDWPSVFSGAQSFNPSVIPVFFRMGRPKHNRIDKKPNRTMGNIELLKVGVK
jgi:small subunit ribosomal protein S35